MINNPTHYVSYWINKTSNDYIGFGENTLTIENVATWMHREGVYVQCTTNREVNKCTQTVDLQVKGNRFDCC